MKQYLFSIFFAMQMVFTALVVPLSLPSLQGEAFAKFPTFMSGSQAKIESNLNKKGKGTLSVMAMVGIMVAGGCIIYGSMKLSTNNGQGAKGYIMGSICSLVLIALVYSIVVYFGKL